MYMYVFTCNYVIINACTYVYVSIKYVCSAYVHMNVVCICVCVCVCLSVCVRARILNFVSKFDTDHFGVLVTLYPCNKKALGSIIFISTNNNELYFP